MPKKPYFVVALFEDGRWIDVLGYYDQAIAKQRADDQRYSRNLRRKEVRVIRCCDDQHSIDCAIRLMNDEVAA